MATCRICTRSRSWSRIAFQVWAACGVILCPMVVIELTRSTATRSNSSAIDLMKATYDQLVQSRRTRTGGSDTNGLTTTDSSDVERTQLSRQRLQSAACARMSAETTNAARLEADWTEMYVDDDRRYVYCLVSKASCTSWKRTLLWLTGKVPRNIRSINEMSTGFVHNHKYSDRILNRTVNIERNEVERRLSVASGYYKFVFVREPLDRLMSAYRDKILSDPAYHVGDLIVQRYRVKTPQSKTNKPMRSKRAIKKATQPMRKAQHPTSGSGSGDNGGESKATFAEFVRYVLDQRAVGNKLDRHWRPQVELCSPCRVRYDFIGHQETLHSDAEHVLDVLRRRAPPSKFADGIRFPESDGSRGYADGVLLRNQILERRLNESSRYVEKMLSQLSADTLRRIVELYDDDYRLFGFDRPQRLSEKA